MNNVTGTDINQAFVPFVRTDSDVSLREAGSFVVMAGGDATITEGGSGSLMVGGDVSMSQAGAGSLRVKGAADIRESAIGSILALRSGVADSRIGVMVAGKATLENTEVVMSTQQAIALGVAAGVTVSLLGRLFRR